MAYIYKFIPKSFYGLSSDDIGSLGERTHAMWKDWADINANDTRIIIHHARHSLDSYIQSLNLLRAKSNKRWRMDGLTHMISTMQEMARQDLFQPFVYLVLFSKKFEEAEQKAITFATQTEMMLVGVPADGITLPKIITAAYTESSRFLSSPAGPFWQGMYLSDFVGQHSVYRPVMGLLNLDFEFLLSYDIHSYANSRLGATLDIKQNQLMTSVYQSNNPLNSQKLQEQVQILRAVRDAVSSGSESIHNLSGAIMYNSTTLESLKNRRNQIISVCSGMYKMTEALGKQGDIIKRFTTIPPWETGDPGKISRSVLSSALTTVTGNGAPEPGGDRGIWHGVSLLNQHPILYNGFGEQGNDANHTLIVGTTGSGKTVFLQTMAYRYALNGVQVIVLEPRGHFKRASRLMGTETAYNDMSFDSGYSLNIFDMVYDNLDTQVAYTINVLSMLLQKTTGFTESEYAVLRQEITDRYNEMKFFTIQNLVIGLRNERWTKHSNPGIRNAATNMADLMEIGILNTGLNDIFNAATTGLDFNLATLNLAVFDFEKVSDTFKGLLYYMILCRIQSICVKEKNIKNRIIIVDEYHLMSSIPFLAESMSMMFKTFRTYGVAIWVAEQNWFTLSGFEGSGGGQNVHGRYLIDNAANVIILYQATLKAARELQEFIPELGDDMLDYITGQQRPGTGIIKLREKVMPFHMELTTHEKRALLGS